MGCLQLATVVTGKRCGSGLSLWAVGKYFAVYRCFMISALLGHGFGGQGLAWLSFGKVSVFMVCEV